MKLTDTNIIPDSFNSIKVEGNSIMDYTHDGNYKYTLNIVDNEMNAKKMHQIIAKIYFNPQMSAKLYYCIHDVLVFDNGIGECDIDDCYMDEPCIVCDLSGRPYMQEHTTSNIFLTRICDYANDYVPNDRLKPNCVHVFVSFGFNIYDGMRFPAQKLVTYK